MPFITGIGQPIEGDSAGVNAVAGPNLAAASLLRLDAEQVDGAIAVFKQAVDDLEDEVERAATAIRADPPANDQVSEDVANAFNRVSTVNKDSAVVAWTGAVEQLKAIITQLEAARQTIVSTDAANTDLLRPG